MPWSGLLFIIGFHQIQYKNRIDNECSGSSVIQNDKMSEPVIVFPNPVSGILYYEITDNREIKELIVFNNFGEKYLEMIMDLINQENLMSADLIMECFTLSLNFQTEYITENLSKLINSLM